MERYDDAPAGYWAERADSKKNLFKRKKPPNSDILP